MKEIMSYRGKVKSVHISNESEFIKLHFDKNGQLISEEKLDNFELTSSYYTIHNNISNKGSSVYVNDNPTLAEYLNFARELPSYGFIVHQGQDVKVMIMIMQEVKDSKTA